jgi:hypothetical protein
MFCSMVREGSSGIFSDVSASRRPVLSQFHTAKRRHPTPPGTQTSTMASNKAAAAASASTSAPLQTHTLHDLLFQLKDDVLHNRCLRGIVDSGDDDNNDNAPGGTTTPGAPTAAVALSDVLLRKARATTTNPLKRRRPDDPILNVEAGREASETSAAAAAAGGEDVGDEREQRLNRYRRLKAECCAEEAHSRKFHEESVRKIRELRAVYLHGLQTVSELQNLREAPDAILPGNFPSAASAVAAAAQGDPTKK